jgi:hypothetical protein
MNDAADAGKIGHCEAAPGAPPPITAPPAAAIPSVWKSALLEEPAPPRGFTARKNDAAIFFDPQLGLVTAGDCRAAGRPRPSLAVTVGVET